MSPVVQAKLKGWKLTGLTLGSLCRTWVHGHAAVRKGGPQGSGFERTHSLSFPPLCSRTLSQEGGRGSGSHLKLELWLHLETSQMSTSTVGLEIWALPWNLRLGSVGTVLYTHPGHRKGTKRGFPLPLSEEHCFLRQPGTSPGFPRAPVTLPHRNVGKRRTRGKSQTCYSRLLDQPQGKWRQALACG